MQSSSNHNSLIKSSRDSLRADRPAEKLDRVSALTADFGPDVFVATGADARRVAADLAELRDLRRRRAAGSVFKRARSKLWQLKYPVGDTWRYESSGTTDKPTANRLLAQRIYLATSSTL